MKFESVQECLNWSPDTNFCKLHNLFKYRYLKIAGDSNFSIFLIWVKSFFSNLIAQFWFDFEDVKFHTNTLNKIIIYCYGHYPTRYQ